MAVAGFRTIVRLSPQGSLLDGTLNRSGAVIVENWDSVPISVQVQIAGLGLVTGSAVIITAPIANLTAIRDLLLTADGAEA